MTKTCPSCDVLAPHDARYCRHCGAPLQRLGAANDAGGDISPIANTVPLPGNNRTDEIVATPAPPPAASQTSEVTPEEMYDLWRRGIRAGDVRDGESSAPSDGQLASARGARNYSSTHQADSLQTGALHGYAPGDFDPEQTQITIPVRPLTSRNLPADAAASPAVAAAARANNKPQFNNAPRQVTLSPNGSLQSPSPTPATAAPHLPAQPYERRAFRVWLGVAVLSVVVICFVAAVAWLGVRGFRRVPETPTPAIAVGEAAPAPDDPKQLAKAKLAEADTLIASGNATEAASRLREAAVLDPDNAEPHHRLARLLLANGSRREAIEELRVVTRLAPADAEAWRSLASAQFAEGLYREALDSYRGLGAASPAALARDAVQLEYADALRLSGRMADAREIYRRLAETSSDTAIAAASKRQLGQPTPSPTREDTADAAEAGDQTADAARAARTAATTTPREEDAPRPPETSPAPPTPHPTATPSRASSGSPSDQYQRGVALWTTNRAAAVAELRAAAERGNSDASYYLGLSITEGRDPRSLKRAELVAALVHFGRARRGKFRAQSVTLEEQLGRELDRRRNQPSQ
ncbi:MAG TPA: tetratricopeptide repeat protein [Pyrinomonadaceae bacterium]|nr:tetratricopeptide repeat protein [Pyrinomonadaceae bacterium]